MRRVALGLLLALGVAAAACFGLRSEILTLLVERRVAANLESDLLRELPDGLHVALCGAGSPLPDPLRSGPCAAVIAGRQLYIVDAGSGASRMLARLRIPQGRIDGILLTHFHSDHIDGLGELLLQRWANGAHRSATPVFGPEGVGEVVAGFQRAYAQDRRYRVAHHGPEVMPPSGAGGVARPFALPPDGEAVPVLEGPLRITAFRVSHAPVEPAVGYRFEYAGRSVVFSGDTVRSANVERFASGADLLVHEALAPELVAAVQRATRAAGRKNLAAITRDILDYHASPVDAAEVAQAAGVGHLLFHHIVPPLPLQPLEALFLAGVGDAYDGPYTLGRDGTLVRLEAGSAAIEVEELL